MCATDTPLGIALGNIRIHKPLKNAKKVNHCPKDSSTSLYHILHRGELWDTTIVCRDVTAVPQSIIKLYGTLVLPILHTYAILLLYSKLAAISFAI